MRRVDILRLFSGLVVIALLSTPALAQSTIEGLTPVPTFPLPDPATTPSHLWITQGCTTAAACDYKIDPLSLGSPYQSTTAPSAPYPNQLWWNTSTTPPTLEAFENSVWTPITSRIRLTANGNLYVSPSGSDTNNGCANSLLPCATIQHAADVAIRNYDLAGFAITVNMANGTYTKGAAIAGPLFGAGQARTLTSATEATDPPGLIFLGNLGSPGSVILSVSDSGLVAGFAAGNGANIFVEGLRISVTNGYGLFASSGAKIQFSNVDFHGNVDDAYADNSGVITAQGNYTISGNSNCHFISGNAGLLRMSFTPLTVTLTGTPTWTTGFICLYDAGLSAIPQTVTFAGSAAGSRFSVAQNSFLDTFTNTSNPTFLPGSSAGVILSGGRYNPPLMPTITGATGLGTGGSAAINSLTPSSSQSGGINLTSGTSGTSGNGQLTLNFQTAEFKTCAVSPTANFLIGSTATSLNQTTTSAGTALTISWQDGPSGTALTTNTVYGLNYVCVAQ